MKGLLEPYLKRLTLAMEKETSYSNLAGSGDELLLMTSAGGLRCNHSENFQCSL